MNHLFEVWVRALDENDLRKVCLVMFGHVDGNGWQVHYLCNTR